MQLAKHWLAMAFGLFLYYTLRFLPGSWWVSGGWLHWLLPFMGYYAYQPPALGWREPMKPGVNEHKW